MESRFAASPNAEFFNEIGHYRTFHGPDWPVELTVGKRTWRKGYADGNLTLPDITAE